MLVLGDMKARRALGKYFSILENEGKARFLSCGNLGEKVNSAKKILESCRLCEHRCGANRLSGERGFCGVLESKVSSEFIHWGEEPELVPSYTVFFAGCTFKCVFCQNYDISQYPESGVHIKPENLAKMIQGVKARNVNWVGGEPTPNLWYILRVLEKLGSSKNIPQVWNSNMYMSVETMNILDGLIDLYLADFKYGNNECAKEYSGVENYFGVVARNHLLARKQGAELIIRHLVLPGHVECCTKPVLDWIHENFGDRVRVNVMDQYRPEYLARDYPGLDCRLSGGEYREAVKYAEKLKLNTVK